MDGNTTLLLHSSLRNMSNYCKIWRHLEPGGTRWHQVNPGYFHAWSHLRLFGYWCAHLHKGLLTIPNNLLQCAVRRRLGVACCVDGPDPHGHYRLAEGTDSKLHTRHTEMVAAWRQIFQETGGHVPDRNIERMLSRTNIPAPPEDLRRLGIMVPGLNIHRGLPLFCDVTIVSPISRAGQPRSGTSNRGGRLLEQAESKNNDDYYEVVDSGVGSLLC